MSGPALRKVESHSMIHRAALGEVTGLTEILEQNWLSGHLEEALQAATVVLGKWEDKILQHASSEEEGLYREIALAHPELEASITALTRDHHLMRKLAAEIKELLANEGVSAEVVKKCYALIIIDELHNQDEEHLVEHKTAIIQPENH